MTNVAILGATGYTALELIRILLRHPGVKIVALTSREVTSPVDIVHPSLTGRLSLKLENLPPEEIARRADCVFSCLPHTATASVAPAILEKGCSVIDFGADYRLSSPEVFQKWYGVAHPDADRLGKVPYGLPELFREEIRVAPLVANPGCYSTSAILPLVPLFKAGLIVADDLIIDAKSGVSGAGRTPSMKTHYPECNEAISAYNVGVHRHTPEIQEIIGRASGQLPELIFTPHLTPMDRGILTVCYAKTAERVTQLMALKVLEDFYQDEPFVKIVSELPSTKDVIHSNRCHITARVVGNRVLTISVIDNLVKGAAGAAVQNFNLLYDYPETTALL